MGRDLQPLGIRRMSRKKQHDKISRERQAKWMKENQQLRNFWRKAPQIIPKLRQCGCELPFFEMLEPYEPEFHKLIDWAKIEFASLFGVFEVESAELDQNEWHRFGISPDWQQVFFKSDEELASSYEIRDDSANLRGSTTGFLDGNRKLH